MKSKVMLFIIFSLFVILFFANVSAELNVTQINQGYSCLQNKTTDCSTSLDDNIFTLLAIKTCRDKVLQQSTNNECWPSGACTVTKTSQALFALKESGGDTSKPKTWLLSKARTPSNIDWFLQIEAQTEEEGTAACNVKYEVNGNSQSHQFTINADKTISANAGSCLQLAENDYWFEIIPQCQSYEYKISCDKEFTTGTLFRESSSSTVHVSSQVNSASAGGTTTEQVNSLCFADGSSCSYEGTLWASLALNSMNEDANSYIPYLVVLADNNPKTLPESFLYILLGESYLNDLLSKQKSSQY